MSPRIKETKEPVYSSSYEYDDLGRINNHTLRGLNYNFMTENINYKNGTLLPNEVKFTLVETESTPYVFKYDYDARGNLKTTTLTEVLGDLHFDYISSYTYDKANRLITEKKIELDDQISYDCIYTYNKDGSIETEKCIGTSRKKYNYQKGRLISFYYDNNPNDKTYFSYDNMGNCTNY